MEGDDIVWADAGISPALLNMVVANLEALSLLLNLEEIVSKW